jgi:type IV pilus assembly protein PilV
MLKHVINSPNDARASGFTLIEVLVALVVLSVGLLGMAKMVMVSAHSNDSAYLRSQATALAYAILENMRANRDQAILHAYDTPLGVMPADPGPCFAAPCAAATLAQFDVFRWKQRLDSAVTVAGVPVGALPSGTGSVVVLDTTIPKTAIVTVQWDDSSAQSALKAAAVTVATPMSVVLETVL